jgi:hypothetical protein
MPNAKNSSQFKIYYNVNQIVQRYMLHRPIMEWLRRMFEFSVQYSLPFLEHLMFLKAFRGPGFMNAPMGSHMDTYTEGRVR